MKYFKLISLLTLSSVLVLSSVGCKKTKAGLTPLPGSGGNQGARTIDDAQPLGPTDGVLGGPGGGELANFDPDSMNQDRAALAAHTIYFAYDSSAIQGGEQAKLQDVAAVLRGNPATKLLIEGHCDERGTEEYNRSLGERRALAAREALAGMGIDPARVATRTFGEDRPADVGHDESAYRKNRRAEFVLLTAR